jgi:hypothetical protein
VPGNNVNRDALFAQDARTRHRVELLQIALHPPVRKRQGERQVVVVCLAIPKEERTLGARRGPSRGLGPLGFPMGELSQEPFGDFGVLAA